MRQGTKWPPYFAMSWLRMVPLWCSRMLDASMGHDFANLIPKGAYDSCNVYFSLPIFICQNSLFLLTNSTFHYALY